MARTLVISDLHLGSVLDRDVLRRRPARRRLLEALSGVDRLVLLGDTVELLEGRPMRAIDLARPVLRALGDALDPGSEIVLVAGNHDHALVRPWLRARRLNGQRLALDGQVAPRSSRELSGVIEALGTRATVEVRYPGVWLRDDVYAMHGHYLDYHLIPELPRRIVPPPLRRLARALPTPTTLEDYETTGGTSLAAVQNLAAAAVPTEVGMVIDGVAGRLRRAALRGVPMVEGLPGVSALGPLTALSVGHRLPGAGARGMAEVARRLDIGAEHVLFGHVHRAGPLTGDRPEAWAIDGQELHNSGCWVWDGLLLANARQGHPYWPGRAVLLEDDAPPRTLAFLDELPARALRP